MKSWFCGFVSDKPSLANNLVKPRQGKLLWNNSNPLWICGSWKKQQIITVSEGSVSLVLLGSCLAEKTTIINLFQNAIEENNYSQLMKLPGNYNAIVQDRHDTYLFVDAVGIKTAFYIVYKSEIVYSSLSLPLQELIEAKLDSSWLASFLYHMRTLNLLQKRSPFCEVKSIPPGHYLHISSGKPICKQYWHGPQKYVSFSEAAEQLREHLSTAVEGRIKLYGNVSSDLSGGFDSTTLAVIAAQTLAKYDKHLHTITNKTISATESSDVQRAKHTADLYRNIKSLMIEGNDLPSIGSNLELVPLTDVPTVASLSAARLMYTSKIIDGFGSQIHLNGEGADEILSVPPVYLADLLKRLQLRKFTHHIYGKSRLGCFSPLALISSAVLLNFNSYNEWLIQLIKKLTTQKNLDAQLLRTKLSTDAFMGWEFYPQSASWYSQKSRDLFLKEIEKWAEIAMPLAKYAGEHQVKATILSSGLSNRMIAQIFATYGINCESPYLDRLVVDTCLSTKPEDRSSPYKYKPLLSQAFKDYLPQSIYARNSKGDYSTDASTFFRENYSQFKKLFHNSLLADLGLIDLHELDKGMEYAKMGFNAGLPMLSLTISLELWLRRFTESNTSFWISVDPLELVMQEQTQKVEVN